jgi:hypothetical protein
MYSTFLGQINKENVMLRSTLTFLLFAFSASVFAQDINYNLGQVSYGQVEFDDSFVDVDGDGFGFSGSLAFNDNVHGFADYQTAGLDFGVDLNLLELGFGYNTALSDNTDFVGRAGYVRVEADAPGVPSADETGFSLGIGVRSAITDALELHGGVDYVDLDDSETRVRAGFLYDFTESLAAGVDGTWWEDVNIYRASIRFYF